MTTGYPKGGLLLTQDEIATRTGISQSTVSYVLRGDRTPSKAVAEGLEETTGICREGWIWPERHYNPYMPLSDPSSCFRCERRVTRIRKTTDWCIAYVEQADDIDAALKQSINLVYSMNGGRESCVLGIREFTPQGMELIAHGSNHPTQRLVTRRDCPWIYEQMERGELVYIPVAPDCFPVEAEVERKLAKITGIRSVLALRVGNFILGVHTLATFSLWTPKMIHELERWLHGVTKHRLQGRQEQQPRK